MLNKVNIVNQQPSFSSKVNMARRQAFNLRIDLNPKEIAKQLDAIRNNGIEDEVVEITSEKINNREYLKLEIFTPNKIITGFWNKVPHNPDMLYLNIEKIYNIVKSKEIPEDCECKIYEEERGKAVVDDELLNRIWLG